MLGLEDFKGEVKEMRALSVSILAQLQITNQLLRQLYREMQKQTAYLALIAHQGEAKQASYPEEDE